jgi:hypothetical protein
MRALAAAVVLVASLHGVAWAAGSQSQFQSPEEATDALMAAVKRADTKALIAILGPSSRDLVSSGDAVADRAALARFAADYDQSHRLEAGGGKIVIHVGRDDFPLPIPIVPDGPVWRFDTDAGREELLARRIGRNELNAIQVCLAFVDAEREYYSAARNGDAVLQYAQRIASTKGKHDGLYWPTRPDEAPSPLGALVARARAEGYGRGRSAGTATPYHGYLYRILTSQGPNAEGGAHSYLAGKRMIGGFGIVAFPSQYGVSGVMTFIVNHDGIVYQKNLGLNTVRLAGQIKSFDPDSTWKPAMPRP